MPGQLPNSGKQKRRNITDFLVHIFPTPSLMRFSPGDILQVLQVGALRFRAVNCRSTLQTSSDVMDSLTRAVLGVVAILMRFAPIGAFGAMAFTIGKYGLASLGRWLKIKSPALYITSSFRGGGDGGIIARLAGFGI